MKTKPKVYELTDLSEGWDICREQDRPIKGRHDDRIYWFFPSGALRMVKGESRRTISTPESNLWE